MKLTIITAAAFAALAATSVSAWAGCADPRETPKVAPPSIPSFLLKEVAHNTTNLKASAAIVGTWYVSYTANNEPFADAYIQWHSDGTEWENINLPVDGGNICMGSWTAVDNKHVSRNHIGWLYTNGTLSGYFTETETDQVSKDGSSYSGTNEQKVYDLNGNLLADVDGTSSAKKISP